MQVWWWRVAGDSLAFIHGSRLGLLFFRNKNDAALRDCVEKKSQWFSEYLMSTRKRWSGMYEATCPGRLQGHDLKRRRMKKMRKRKKSKRKR
ncbi:hypothetical protein E2C01_046978 [Portunus trituberculatus]|uniref:Uncharacterized protein n=1 Tax=Portunus trituberculatus TaxID=210409 RepID=A0A5B7G987_PORTR|nr:hypothetical protein [Portunus trituberculatus]